MLPFLKANLHDERLWRSLPALRTGLSRTMTVWLAVHAAECRVDLKRSRVRHEHAVVL